jgi:hypothetical protein
MNRVASQRTRFDGIYRSCKYCGVPKWQDLVWLCTQTYDFEGWDLHLNPSRGTKDALDEEQVDYWKKSTSGLIPAHNFTTGQGSRMIEQYNAHLHM